MTEPKPTKHVLPKSMGGGPKGLGDPDSRTLRKVEKDILIPKLMKEEAMKLCEAEVSEFSECGKKFGFRMTFKCKQENMAMQECYIKWFNNEQFKEQMTEKYLQERSEYRRTGIPPRVYRRHH